MKATAKTPVIGLGNGTSRQSLPRLAFLSRHRRQTTFHLLIDI